MILRKRKQKLFGKIFVVSKVYKGDRRDGGEALWCLNLNIILVLSEIIFWACYSDSMKIYEINFARAYF